MAHQGRQGRPRGAQGLWRFSSSLRLCYFCRSASAGFTKTTQAARVTTEMKQRSRQERAEVVVILICSWIFAALAGFIAASVLIKYYGWL
jgi:hypothetical protein